jgi:hypothetical protein
VRRLRLAGAYTLQLVAGGRFQAVGSDARSVRDAIAVAARARAGPVALRRAAASDGKVVVDIGASWEA